MTVIACLRILIDPDRAAAGGETLAILVAKVADAFLESRWRWPRRHGPIAAYAFLLADPRATQLDAVELSSLSDELQLKLFGSSEAGAICMAMLEGEQEMVTRFATIDPAELRRVLKDGGTIEGLTGRMTESDLLAHTLQKRRAGDEVAVTVVRNGRRETLRFALQ